jgi:hypothetical protein
MQNISSQKKNLFSKGQTPILSIAIAFFRGWGCGTPRGLSLLLHKKKKPPSFKAHKI